MEEFKGNSYKSKAIAKKPEEQDIEKKEKIISGSAKSVKKTGFQKFGETLKEAAKRVVNDIVIPAAKKSLSDGINNMTDIMIYGEPQHRSSSSSSIGRTVSYRSYYDDRRRNDVVSRPSRVATRDYDDIILETRGDADAVLNEMMETIAKYDYVKVADLYDLVGLSHSYTDNNYGWDNLDDAYIERVSDGYKLRLPRPMSIDR